MLLKDTFRTTLFTLTILQGASGSLFSDPAEHTFTDGATLQYTLPEGSAEISDTPVVVSDAKFYLPYIGEVALQGSGDLSKESSEKYTLKLLPASFLKTDSTYNLWTLIKPSEKGSLTLKISDEGENIQATNFTIEHEFSQISGEKLDYSHTFKQVDETEDFYNNTIKLEITNGLSKVNAKPAGELDLESFVNNPFSKFKELVINASYISGKNFGDFKKDLVATYHARGHKGFVLDGSVKSGFPFAHIPEAEKLPGYTMSLSIPVIDMRAESEEEKKGIMETLQHNADVYEHLLGQYENPFTDALLASLKKHREELINRSYKYFTELSKDDISSFFLTVKSAQRDAINSGDLAFVDADLAVRNFKLRVALAATEAVQKVTITMDEPEASIKELTSFVLSNAYLIEPVLKDMGYWEIIQNFANPEKILALLRQLSDDPKATGNAPLVISFVSDATGSKVGTLDEEKAGQLLLGWALSIVPIK